MQHTVWVNPEKRPSPFDDENPNDAKRLKRPGKDTPILSSTPSESVDSTTNKSYDVCIGMLHSTVTGLSVGNLHNSWDPVLHLEHCVQNNILTLSSEDSEEYLGLLEFKVAKALAVLKYRFGTIFDIYLPETEKKRFAKKGAPQLALETCIIIYGMRGDIAAIGTILGDHELYLQHPKHHDNSIPYDNPHYLVRPGGKLVIRDSQSTLAWRTKNSSDIIAEDDPLRGRIDEVLDSMHGPSIFSRVSVSQRLSTTLKRYKNVVTHGLRVARPPLCLGGLLADEMGLGKTLTALALIMTSLDSVEYKASSSRTTLIITPLSVLSGWEEQIERHIYNGAVKWFVYHGMTKSSSPPFENYDIVLTTYDTVAGELTTSRKKNPSSVLKSFEWERVIIDEAHLIRNPSSIRHNAILGLRATYRWCLTGTPIFNRVDDFGSLLKFLKVYPFESRESFTSYIAQPLKKDPTLGLKNLKSLVQAVSLRRTKNSVLGELQLAPRVNRVEKVQFNSKERYLYSMLRKNFSQNLNVSDQKSVSSGHVFQMILRLRQFCNHGYDLFPAHVTRAFAGTNDYERLTQSLLEDSDMCVLCNSNIAGDDMNHNFGASTSCGHRFCGPCLNESLNDGATKDSDCPICCSFGKLISFNERDKQTDGDIARREYEPSSKVRALLQVLEDEKRASLPGESIKSVIFSSWTTMLDILEIAMKAKGYQYSRIDGKLQDHKRREALNEFRTDKNHRILLASTASVGLGVNLTEASNIHVLEPLWSPMAEEQAIDRVHRLGQVRQVVATRYIVQNSIEEYVVAIQQAKKHVIRSAIGDGSHSEKSKNTECLFQYIAAASED